ncbi:MAG: YraN family protein [Pseudoscardovia radai]|nr:YraN family protein [Pseudoscardovia radai]
MTQNTPDTTRSTRPSDRRDAATVRPADTRPATARPGEGLGLDALARRMAHGHVPARELGALGEEYACRMLETHGWRIVDRNWHCRYGELDVIAIDPAGTLVFVEVKTRRGHGHGTPQEAVTFRKRLTMRRSSCLWLTEKKPGMRTLRYDVVAIEIPTQGPDRMLRFTHLEGAL